ncbi:hypothetical protein XELAEV_18033455mg [Xenopus laevis]|uniref:Uncharacterized protein n=1 Tax=Xenopus laevis TaxID=8355 RepID=A0A974HEF8_XENLA|nr:hypothetical protein XELAEV_18033455mg [Xenopus laevis]
MQQDNQPDKFLCSNINLFINGELLQWSSSQRKVQKVTGYHHPRHHLTKDGNSLIPGRPSQRNQHESAYDRRSQASNRRLSQHHKNLRPPTAHSHSRSPVESSNHSRRPSHYLDDQSGKCSQICSIRVITGYTSAAGFGTFSINSAYSPIDGNELKQVLDVQSRVPGIYGGLPFTIRLCGLSLFPYYGFKTDTQVTLLQLVFIYILLSRSTLVMSARQECLYAGRGYTWMNCEVQGGDDAVALFDLIAACLYLPSAIMCALYIKTRDHNGSHKPEEELFHPSTFVLQYVLHRMLIHSSTLHLQFSF